MMKTQTLYTHFLGQLSLALLLVSSFLLSPCTFANNPSSRTLQFDSFGSYVNNALHGVALEDFEAITAEVENNIFWKKKARTNKYQDAFKRSAPHLANMLRDDIPDFIFLIPYLESGWNATKGNTHTDYGYWQLVQEVVDEIQKLDQASDVLRDSHPDVVRSDPDLSTEAALIHLKRYYFYFRHVAHFEEADAWLFSVTAFNWGAGNIKRMLQQMQQKGNYKKAINFADFYHYLFEMTKKHPKNKSMRVALEYLPNLWNIALLVQTTQREQNTQSNSISYSENKALTLNKSSSVSIP